MRGLPTVLIGLLLFCLGAGEPRIRVSALLLWRDRILLCRHEKPGKEYWLLPGGGVRSGAHFRRRAWRIDRSRACHGVQR